LSEGEGRVSYCSLHRLCAVFEQTLDRQIALCNASLMPNRPPKPQAPAGRTFRPSIRHLRELAEIAEIRAALLEFCDPEDARRVDALTREICLNLMEQERIEARLRELKAASRPAAAGGENLAAAKPATRAEITGVAPPTFRPDWRADLPWSPTRH